jgi:purine-binding chemotaxis protein CheW
MSRFDHFSAAEHAILQARAVRVAKAVTQTETETLETNLVVEVNAEQYVVSLKKIAAVYQNVQVTQVPCTPEYVAGIANIRGYIVPVLHLGRLLYGTASEEPQATILFVVSNDDGTLAFRVDALGDVITYATSQVKALPPDVNLEMAHCLRGILAGNQILIDLDALLKDERLTNMQSGEGNDEAHET